MSDKVGAVPAELIRFPSSVQSQAGPLNAAANRLNTAITAFNEAPKSAGLVPSVPYAGNAILGYVARNQVIDTWVGKVGQAFAVAGGADSPALSGAEVQAVLSGLVTSSNSYIAGQAGSNPTAAAEQAAAGTEAGAQLGEGVGSKNQALVNGALSQLAKHEGQGGFDVAFFMKVGPQGTLAAVPMVARAPAGLQTFDDGLATATRSAGWDPAFNAALFKPERFGFTSYTAPSRFTIPLLEHGNYSTDFLTQAADSWVFRTSFRAYDGDTAMFTTIFKAMARNPVAASDWLSGQAPGAGTPDSRIGALLGPLAEPLWQNMVLGQPDQQKAFNRVLAAAGSVHNTTQLWTILGGIYPRGGKPTQAAMPFWPGTASIISQNIGMFDKGGPLNSRSPDWTYNQRLFDFAETSLSSTVHKQAAEDILNAIKQWTLHEPVPAGRDGWRTFEDNIGQLWGTQALPLKQAAVDSLHNFQDDQATWSRLAGLVPLPPIPGAGFWTSYAVGQGFSLLKGWLAPKLADGLYTSQYQVDANSDTVSNAYKHSLQETLALKWLDENPSQVPHGIDRKDYAMLILANLPKSPAKASSKVDYFTGELGWAGEGFSNVFDGKTSAGPNAGSQEG